MSQYQTIKTTAGLALEAAAETGGPAITLSAISLGDGNGQPVQPSVAQTGLVHEIVRAPLASLSRSDTNPAQWTAEGNFSADQGGYTAREVGLWTASGVLFAVAAIPDLYKPNPSELAAGELLVAMTFATQNSDNIVIQIDGSVEMASREWVSKQLSAAEGQTTDSINTVRTETRAVAPPPVRYFTATYDPADSAFFAREQGRLLVALERQQRQAQTVQQGARLRQAAQLAEQKAEAAYAQLATLEQQAAKISTALQKFGVTL